MDLENSNSSVSRGIFGTWRAGRRDWRLQALSVFSLSVAFICLAAAILVVTNVEALRDRWSRAGRATIYLKDSAKEPEVAALSQALSQTEGVSRVRRVTAEEARKEVISSDESLAALPVEAFPGSLEIAFNDSITDDQLQTIALKLRALPAVDTVETYEKWTDRLSALLGGGVTAALFLAVIVLGAVVSVVGSTMRLLLQRRKIEVEVLRLVGATDNFVRTPFVVEGATQGAMGAGLAIAVLFVLFLIVKDRFDQQLSNLTGLMPTFLPLPVALAMIALGAFLGGTTAFFSLRKIATV
jgi:cell division transport system permease protein